MRLLLNIFWLIFGGLFIALGYAIAGIICFILIITIPFGVAAFRMANYALWPFGRTTRPKPSAGVGAGIGNVIWFIVAGWWLALGHIITAVGLAITVIGIPFAWAHLKLVPISLWPIGKMIVSTEEAEKLRSGRRI